MKISLIGMSGVGKTYWAKKLAKKGFICYCCDDLIERKLREEAKYFGRKGTKAVSKWMGQPFDKSYHKKSKKYLFFEKLVLEDVLSKIRKHSNDNVVLDTTGSVIYTGSKLMKRLSILTKIVYLRISKRELGEMYKLYLKDPKPVFWGNTFKKYKNETDIQALKRCYSKLIDFRIKEYENFADVIIQSKTLKNQKFNINKFLNLIK